MEQRYGVDDLKRLVAEVEHLAARMGRGEGWFDLCDARRLLRKGTLPSDPEFQNTCDWLDWRMPHWREAADLNDDIGEWPGHTSKSIKTRLINCLINHDIKKLSDLVKIDRDTMLAAPNFGRKSMDVLEEIMRRRGLTFAGDGKRTA